ADGTFVNIQEIAAITFTRACAQELSSRIFLALQETEERLSSNIDAPDYILAIKEKGDGAISLAKDRIHHAKMHFDKAQISTIHSFAFEALQEYSSFLNDSFEKS